MYAKRLRKLDKTTSYPTTPKYSKKPTTCVVGVDPSLNGSAVSWHIDGKLFAFQGWTATRKMYDKHKRVLCYLKMPTRADAAQRQYRADLMATWILSAVAKARNMATSVYVAMEGYSMSSRAQQGHLDMAEMIGSVKHMLWKSGIPLRLYDPLSIKLAWTGDGSAEKEDMINACRREFIDLRGYIASENNTAPADNLADAILIGALLQKELDIRAGRLPLDKVGERIRAVMLRTTKSHPEAPITRKFIWAGDVEMPQPMLAKGRA